MAKVCKKIAFQGAHGAYSEVASRAVFPGGDTLPCDAFDDAFAAVANGQADLAMIPVDNTIAGRVADVHHLIPKYDLYIIGEHFEPIHHHLLGVKRAKLADLKYVHSHVHAIPQCRKAIKRLGLQPHVHADTAGAAKDVAERKDKAHAAIASSLAAETYGLDILEENIHDAHHNTTRFLILSREPLIPEMGKKADTLTSLLFEVRNIPAALYKTLGGFATSGISMTKLESYVDENFQAARFYCEVEGHPESKAFKLALEEMGFYAKDVKFVGAYPAHPFRKTYANNRKEY
jgi:prephenate dehydratase